METKGKDNGPIIVTIRCLTYNHEPYIRQCLEGFVMQKTNFRFEAIVHDDVSTDGTTRIIREYAEKYPDIIKPIYEIENQYSKHDGSLKRVMDAHIRGKYVALCEGDDYWIDPLKLQKQVDYMESHPKCSLCFHAHQELFPDGSKLDVHRYLSDVDDCPMKDVIMGGGGFMATNSMLYRRNSLVSPPPKWYIDCPVGDAPLMLLLASSGCVGYLDELLSCYRRVAIGSWSQRMSASYYRQTIHNMKIRKMWKSFDKYTGYRWHVYIDKKVRQNDYNHLKSLFWFLKGQLKSLI